MALTVLSALVLAVPQAGEIPSSAGRLRLERVAAPLEFPWGMAYLPDGRLLITEKAGRLRILSGSQLSAAVPGVPKVVYNGQGGLLDVAVHPDFATNNLVFLFFTEAATRQPAKRKEAWDRRLGPKPKGEDTILKGGAVARGRLVDGALRDVKVIWRQKPKMSGRGHFGGRLAFGPDGKLWITSGDRQRFEPAQSRNGNLGKVLRINSDGSLPADNPFAGSGIADVWSIGHRNSLGFAFDPATGKLWAHEMGPLGGDELNLIHRGHNFGWPVVSNGINYDRSRIPHHDTQPRFTEPNLTWNPVISPSGMAFYGGNMFPTWRGHMLIGGLSSKALVRVSLNNGLPKEEERIGLYRRIRDVIEAPDGSLLLLTDAKQGALMRLTKAR